MRNDSSSAFPTNPVAVGALSSVAAGVVSDAGWRLTCGFPCPRTAHVLAIALAGATGALLGAAFDRWRWRASWRCDSPA